MVFFLWETFIYWNKIMSSTVLVFRQLFSFNIEIQIEHQSKHNSFILHSSVFVVLEWKKKHLCSEVFHIVVSASFPRFPIFTLFYYSASSHTRTCVHRHTDTEARKHTHTHTPLICLSGLNRKRSVTGWRVGILNSRWTLTSLWPLNTQVWETK